MDVTFLPAFVTFTGVDEHTDPDEMLALGSLYPIEWGILFSPGRQGQAEHPRYPRIEFIQELLSSGTERLKLAAHLCGDAAREVMAQGKSRHDELLAAHFERAQVNTGDPQVDAIAQWAARAGVLPIVQCRDAFPHDKRVQYLFDASGGRGISPQAWPPPPTGDIACGYAGGINPANAAASVAVIGRRATRYWIDMETGVRDEQGRFSTDRCRQVCEAVFDELRQSLEIAR